MYIYFDNQPLKHKASKTQVFLSYIIKRQLMKTFKCKFSFFLFFLLFTSNFIKGQQLQTPMTFQIDSPLTIAGTYDYGYAIDWGPTTLPQDISGELVWGYTALGDSLACTPITTNLTGKIALVRRGNCAFSLKAYHAQQAGALGTIIINQNPVSASGGGIFNIVGLDSASAVNTPTILISLEDGNLIDNELSNGNKVKGQFSIRLLENSTSLNHYVSPQSQIKSLTGLSVTVSNRDTFTETNLTISAIITNPNGIVTTLTENIAQLPPNSDSIVSFSSLYTPPKPTAVGEYEIKFTVSSDSTTYNNKSAKQIFIVSPYTWANDNGENVVALFPPPAQFTIDLRYDIGNIYTTKNTGIVTHASFGLAQPLIMDGEVLNLVLYDIDTDLDGIIDGSDYIDFNPIATATYTVDALVMPSWDTVVVELNPISGSEITLNSGGMYMITVQYDALANGNGNTTPPYFIHADGPRYDGSSSVIYTDKLYLGGFASGREAILRLHQKGFGVLFELPFIKKSTAVGSTDTITWSKNSTTVNILQDAYHIKVDSLVLNNNYLVFQSDSLGTDTLTVETCDASSCDTLYYLIKSEIGVWAGDTDTNQVANNYDLLNVGLAYSSTGVPRDSINNFWNGALVDDWGITLPKSKVDYKHIDANGDGIINDDDTLAILDNYRLSYTYKKNSGTIPLFLDADTVTVGNTNISIPIILGTPSFQVNNFYGIAYSIDYDTALVVPNSVSITHGNSWIGNTSVLLDIYKDFYNDGVVETAVVRTDGLWASGFGKIGTLNLTIQDDILQTLDSITFDIHSIKCIDPLENPIQVVGGLDTLFIKNATATNQINLQEYVVVYPNPVSHELIIQANNLAIESILLINSSGQVVQETHNLNQRIHQLQVNHHNNGLYFYEYKPIRVW